MGSVLLGDTVWAVNDVSVELPADSPWILSLVGESGSGKTTLAKMILGLVQPSSGDIRIDGVSIGAYVKNRKAFYRKVQTVFQNPFSAFSQRKTVDTYMYETALNLNVARNRAEAREIIESTLSSVGLAFDRIEKKYPNQLSGGELQRVAIARALIPKPDIIVADEPVAMVDASLKMNIVNIFKDLRQKNGISFVYITHDLSTAYYISDYIATMFQGRIIEYGGASQVLEHPTHPYTRLLIDSIPNLDHRWDYTQSVLCIESSDRQSSGCKFAFRCPKVQERCRKELPGNYLIEDGHQVTCFHCEE